MDPRTYEDPEISSQARHCGSFHNANVLPAIGTGPASFAECRSDRTSERTDPTPPGDLDSRLYQYASRGWDLGIRRRSMIRVRIRRPQRTTGEWGIVASACTTSGESVSVALISKNSGSGWRTNVSGGSSRDNADDSKADNFGEEGVDEGFMMPINGGPGVQLD